MLARITVKHAAFAPKDEEGLRKDGIKRNYGKGERVLKKSMAQQESLMVTQSLCICLLTFMSFTAH